MCVCVCVCVCTVTMSVHHVEALHNNSAKHTVSIFLVFIKVNLWSITQVQDALK